MQKNVFFVTSTAAHSRIILHLLTKLLIWIYWREHRQGLMNSDFRLLLSIDHHQQQQHQQQTRLGSVRFQFAMCAPHDWQQQQQPSRGKCKGGRQFSFLLFFLLLWPNGTKSSSISQRVPRRCVLWWREYQSQDSLHSLTLHSFCQSMFRVSWHRNKLYSSHGAFSLPFFILSACLRLRAQMCTVLSIWAKIVEKKERRTGAPSVPIFGGRKRRTKLCVFTTPSAILSLSSVSRSLFLVSFLFHWHWLLVSNSSRSTDRLLPNEMSLLRLLFLLPRLLS